MIPARAGLPASREASPAGANRPAARSSDSPSAGARAKGGDGMRRSLVSAATRKARWLRRGLAALAVGLALGGAARAALAPQPPASLTSYRVAIEDGFQGEHLRYRLGWLGIPAAEAEWTVSRRPGTAEPVLSAEARVRTLAAVDPLYRLRTRVQATLAARPILPGEFLLRTEDGKYREEVVRFDHAHRTVTYAQLGGRKPHERQGPVSGQYDPVSAAFALRGLPLHPGDTARIEVQTPSDLYRLEVRVVGRQRIRVPAGTFDAVELAPTIWNETRNRRPRGFESARLWVTDDARHLPLRLTSEVMIGSVYVELVSSS